MDVARLHRRGAAGRIAHVADDQPVQVGLVLAPVGVVLDVLEMAAAHPFLELPRPRADRRVVGRVGDGIAAGVDVLGNDVVHVAAEQRGEEELRRRLVEAHHDGVGIRCGDAGEVGERGGRGVLLPDLVDRIDDVVDGHILAVVELHALADLDGVGLEVGGGLPGLGQFAGERAVHAAIAQPLEQLGRGEGRRGAAARRHVAGLRFAAAPGGDQRAAALGCFLCERSLADDAGRQNAGAERTTRNLGHHEPLLSPQRSPKNVEAIFVPCAPQAGSVE